MGDNIIVVFGINQIFVEEDLGVQIIYIFMV